VDAGARFTVSEMKRVRARIEVEYQWILGGALLPRTDGVPGPPFSRSPFVEARHVPDDLWSPIYRHEEGILVGLRRTHPRPYYVASGLIYREREYEQTVSTRRRAWRGGEALTGCVRIRHGLHGIGQVGVFRLEPEICRTRISQQGTASVRNERGI